MGKRITLTVAMAVLIASTAVAVPVKVTEKTYRESARELVLRDLGPLSTPSGSWDRKVRVVYCHRKPGSRWRECKVILKGATHCVVIVHIRIVADPGYWAGWTPSIHCERVKDNA